MKKKSSSRDRASSEGAGESSGARPKTSRSSNDGQQSPPSSSSSPPPPPPTTDQAINIDDASPARGGLCGLLAAVKKSKGSRTTSEKSKSPKSGRRSRTTSEKSKSPKSGRRSRTTSEKCTSPTSSCRPVLSSQCTSRSSTDADVSPIKYHCIYSDPYFWRPPIDIMSDSRFDFGALDEDKIVTSFLGSRTCYNSMPVSGKVVVLSSELLVKNAFSSLVSNDIHAAPLWESSTHTFIGMLTITDFINVLRLYYYSSMEDIKSIENQAISTWRKITNVARPIVRIYPNDNLLNATKLLLQERVHRLPVYNKKGNNVMCILTRKVVLEYLYRNLLERMCQVNVKTPSFLLKTLRNLRPRMGTWENIAKVFVNSKVIEALDLFSERRVSSLPVVDEENRLIDIFAKFDVFSLAKEQTYDNLDMSVSEAIHKAEVHENVCEGYLDDSLGSVINTFVNRKIHRMCVVEEDCLIGIVSLSDILNYLVLQSPEESGITSDTIDEAPEGAIGGIEDSSVFIDSGSKSSVKFEQSSSLEKQDSSDLSEEISKLQLEADTPEPLSEASVCED